MQAEPDKCMSQSDDDLPQTYASDRLMITEQVSIGLDELTLSAIRAQGAGGQHINKTSSAIHLRFDIRASTLPEDYKTTLLAMRHHWISDTGIVVIKSQAHRSQQKNRLAALSQLQMLIKTASVTPKLRQATRPSRNARRRRTDQKIQRGQTKALRRKIEL